MINPDGEKIICPKCMAKFIYLDPNTESELLLMAGREAEKQEAIRAIENLKASLEYRRTKIDRLKLAIETKEEPIPSQKEIDAQEQACIELENRIIMYQQVIK